MFLGLYFLKWKKASAGTVKIESIAIEILALLGAPTIILKAILAINEAVKQINFYILHTNKH